MSKKQHMLADGRYRARCRDTSLIQAAANGHSSIWPEAELEVKEGGAMFYRDGTKVWSCNVHYAAFHFDLSPL